MRKKYDFSTARKNLYASHSEQVGIPHPSLANLYLRDCAASHRKLNLNWK